jgi:hypothetical protein
MVPSQRERFRLNAAGDFYVENGQCITCLAPEHAAPALMGFHKDPTGSNRESHCYFARQPQSQDEIYRAIRAVWSGCCGALRYAGTDPEVIRRLTDLGLEGQVDARPLNQDRPVLYRQPRVVRDHVTFTVMGGGIDAPAVMAVVAKWLVGSRSPFGSVTDVESHADSARVTYSWYEKVRGMLLTVKRSQDGPESWLLIVGTGDGHVGTMGISFLVDDCLRGDHRVSAIRWYTRDDWNAGHTRWTSLPC